MKTQVLVHKGSILKVNLDVMTYSASPSYITTKLSPEYVIRGSTVFQVRLLTVCIDDGDSPFQFKNCVFIRFAKRRPDDHITYTIKFTSSLLCITNEYFNSDSDTWRLVNENELEKRHTIDVSVQVDTVPSMTSFSSLHNDTELTDFELKGIDGSVRFHKTILAIASPVLEKSIKGSWREATEGISDVQGTSVKALQHLKNYIYLDVLPDEDLEQLLLLSSYYMIPILEQRCVEGLVSSMTEKNMFDLIEFAVSHKMRRLILAILKCVQKGTINVNKMFDDFMLEEQISSACNKTMKGNSDDQVGDC